jgi:endonuclease YncB( thermonuclease family)
MRRFVITLAGFLLAAALGAAPAWARSGPCMAPGIKARCSIWTGKVTWVSDGDTFNVDLDGDRTHRTVIVRTTGINTFEQSVYSSVPSERRGDCHALEATARLEQLLRKGGWRVRLAAFDASSTSRRRWRRAVAVKLRGRWRDVGRILVAEGHAQWLSTGNEWLWNAGYSALAERAAAARRGIWNPTYCGRGPQDRARLRLTVNGDADGLDSENLSGANGEWIRIRNLDPHMTVHLGGWSLQQSAPHRYTLPEWVTLPPGEVLTVHVGRGTDTWTDVFMGLRHAIFDEPSTHGTGDGGYLFDPQGDLRAWSTYPCRLACTDPYQGAVKLSVKALGRESVTVTNVGTATIDLDGYRIWSPPDVYAFPIGSVVAPGERLRVDVVGDPDEDTRLVKSWGKPTAIFGDRGDVVRLTNLRGVQLECVAYGSARC